MATLPILLTALMAIQALLGLLRADAYRDVEWIKATWYGNDWVTLAAAVPLLAFGAHRARQGAIRGQLLVLGMAGYATYNYAFYLFGAALNVFFPLYAAGFLLGVGSLGACIVRLDTAAVAASFRPTTPVRLIGGYLIFVAVGLAAVWLSMWAAYAFAGRPTPIDPDAFKVVAALDLCLMVPALASGGVLLWKRRPWGYLIATVAALQGAVYLLVLTVNGAIAIVRNLANPPGELPIWAPLGICTAICAVVLMANATGRLDTDAPYGASGVSRTTQTDRRVTRGREQRR